ncbi:tetratricopeptide repeat protein [Leptolyngbyaceae cyanobacterium CCMR0082]|uniref:Tetratricopeptide repeat protein n=1 Tax=Adonisia turfae CCMR0082 TaxID=2304604 RepID=A0A6M0SCJ1_9CYAN|nr:tetratricopeptide repeat protein [Adonisia turfae]MDV3350411.1 tetratricopeptide repeat protein [Leptothoe sp. LEGE 181152]NEZ65701.1 tetratricopeptide repeat protein [Adonisia turfae CCMR0082]
MSLNSGNSVVAQCSDLIEGLIQATLKGKIRSKTQVYRQLKDGLPVGSGEIFERCLAERMQTAEQDKSLKGPRIVRALKMVQGEWANLQKTRQVEEKVSSVTAQLSSAVGEDQLDTLLKLLDPNQDQPPTRDQLQQLAQSLQAESNRTLGKGIESGLAAFRQLEGELVSWLYEAGDKDIGFGSEQRRGPWQYWAKRLESPVAQQLFDALAKGESVTSLAEGWSRLDESSWVQLAILLHYLKRGLVKWFDQQPYNVKLGKKLSYSTFLIFANIEASLAQGFQASRPHLSRSSFQLMQQSLRSFAQRDDFPLYGGVFAAFDGGYLQDTLDYFSEPLKQVPGTQEKARLLTLLGYSQRTLGRYEAALEFHQEALEISTAAGDQCCVIASFNHLARVHVLQKNYGEAKNFSQRALIMARQQGDVLGEANALVNYGYSEVFAARAIDTPDLSVYEQAIGYLERGRDLAETLGDFQSKALAYNSMGIAYSIAGQPGLAIATLEQALPLTQAAGNVYLQGVTCTYLAEAQRALGNVEASVLYGALGMYLLHQIGSSEWRQGAGLLRVVSGELGDETFEQVLQRQRRGIIQWIGVDGFDYLRTLLGEY